MRATEAILTQLTQAIEEGKRGRMTSGPPTGEASAGGPGHERRSKRVTTSSLAAQQLEPPSPATPDESVVEAVASPVSEEAASSPSPEVSDGVS